MNKFSGKASLMATLVAAWVGASSAQAAEIKIGVVLPLSGALSGYGQPSQKGLDIIQSITPTLKNGDTVKLIVIDDKSDKVEAANAMQRLVSSDKVDAVIGEVTSSNTLAMTKIADDSKTPLVSSTATNDRVTRNHPYVSRVCFSDSFQGVVGANLASRDLKAKTAAIVFDSSNDYSVGLAKAFRTQFLKNGGTIPIEVQAPGGSKDFKAQLASVKANYYKAARVDGTSKWRTFARITLPMISPTIFYLVITGFIGAFKAYSDAVALFGTDLNAAQMNTMVGYIYDMLYGDSGGYPSFASAAAIILFAIVLTITCINLLVSRKHVHY